MASLRPVVRTSSHQRLRTAWSNARPIAASVTGWTGAEELASVQRPMQLQAVPSVARSRCSRAARASARCVDVFIFSVGARMPGRAAAQHAAAAAAAASEAAAFKFITSAF